MRSASSSCGGSGAGSPPRRWRCARGSCLGARQALPRGGRRGCGSDADDARKWRRRFCELRLDGLSDDPRTGRPARITTEQVEEVLVATLESTPENASTGRARRWLSARGCRRRRSGGSGGRLSSSRTAPHRTAPHRTDTFKLSTDPLFVEKVYDVVGLYLDPPEGAVVYCVDEKSQVQALARSQPAFPMMPGMCEKLTHDYLRHGTTSLFAAFNTTDGTVISSLHRRHRTIEFTKFLTKIDSLVPDDLDVHLVCDNYGTHKSPRSGTGLSSTPASTSTTHLPTPAGSTRSKDGSPI